MSSSICSAFNCVNSSKNTKGRGVSFFYFPKDTDRCKKWVQNSRLSNLRGFSTENLHKKFRICSDHFEKIMFMNPNERKRLVWNAIPTLFDIPNPPARIESKRKVPARESEGPPMKKMCVTGNTPSHTFQNPEVTTKNETQMNDDTQGKKKMRAIIKRQRVKISKSKRLLENYKNGKFDKYFDKVLGQTSKVLPERLQQFFISQVKMSKRQKQGYRWTDADKLIALSIYYSSPKTFRILSNLFILPSVSSVKRWVKNITSHPGFHHATFDVLEKKFQSLTLDDKTCIITFDEMSIKKALAYNAAQDQLIVLEDFGNAIGKTSNIANHALVFIVRGIKLKWKQPIGYFLSSNSTPAHILKTLLSEAIELVQKIGGIVKGIVCDLGSTNRSLFQNFGVSPKKPYIVINNEKIFFFFDPPHLIKCTRNNLRKYNFIYNEKLVKWRYVEELFENDSKLPVRMCPKLSPKHINLNNFSKMRVSLATQVLSHSVAAAICTYTSLGAMEPEALNTAKFLVQFDQLFDCFNSHHLIDKLKPHKPAVSDKSVHVKYLSECQEMFSKLTPVGTDADNLHFINGWKMSISALMGLWEDLSNKFNFKFLLTNRLNQDCLENLFSQIRQSGICRDNPNAEQFAAAYKQCLVNLIIRPPKNSNCIKDTDTILSSLEELTKKSSDFKQNAASKLGPCQQTSSMDVTDHTYTSEHPTKMDLDIKNVTVLVSSLPEKNILHYIAGYVIKKLKKNHENCKVCKFDKLVYDQKQYQSDQHTFIYWKALYNEKGCFGGLTVPSNCVGKFIEKLENIFRGTFEYIAHQGKIKMRLCSKMLNCSDDALEGILCDSAINYIIELFIIIRIHGNIKFQNYDLAKTKTNSKKAKRDRKTIKVMHL